MTPRVMVMGGSLGGLNAALWLRDLGGCDVTVYERSRTPLSGLGSGIVLNPATVRYFTSNDILDVEDISIRTRFLRYMGQDGGTVHEQPRDYRFSSYNALYTGFLNSFDENRYNLNQEVVGFEGDTDGVTVRFADGTERCDMLVCADGIRSAARRSLLPDVSMEYAGYIAWRGTIGDEDIAPPTYAALCEAITYHVMPDGHVLTYPIPGSQPGRPHINWLWYRNVRQGPDLDDLMTDGEGVRREVSLPPGMVQERHLKKLREDAKSILPPPLVAVLFGTAEPYLQVIFDIEVPRMAFGRVALIGDAAFAARPHAAAGSAKAAEDAFKLAQTMGALNGDVPTALKKWEPGQLQLGRGVLRRTREAGRKVQFDAAWKVGDPLPFGLYRTGDSEMP